MAGDGAWYYVRDGKTEGPMSREDLVRALPSVAGPNTMVWGPGVSEWIEARHVVALVMEYRDIHNF